MICLYINYIRYIFLKLYFQMLTFFVSPKLSFILIGGISIVYSKIVTQILNKYLVIKNNLLPKKYRNLINK